MGRVEQHLINTLKTKGHIHLTLIDPQNTNPMKAAKLTSALEKYGTTAIMVGGSTVVSIPELDAVIKAIKKSVNIPVILFPNNITGISQYADAIWFMSLLNSSNPHFITGIQALGVPIVKQYGLEAISLGYIIIGEGSTAAYMGQAHAIPHDKPEIASIYALAAQYLGMHFVYLEAGSGSKKPVPPKMISMVKKNLKIPLIVGGGIRSREAAEVTIKAGTDGIVTGTIIEKDQSGETIKNIIEYINTSKKKKGT
jgi:phosphoglycerol geranylgeranyltransferase